MIHRNFPNSGIELVQNEYYYLVVNHKKGGSFRLITKGGSYTDSGVLKNMKEVEIGIINGTIFNFVNLFLGWSGLYRRILKAWLRSRVVQEGKYELRDFEISERQIIVHGPTGGKASYLGHQSSRYFSPAELAKRKIIPQINDSIRTFIF
ncbi:MAG TPA: hypothetical protein VJI73_01510 [Candidatus Paceibacterota bacterium]